MRRATESLGALLLAVSIGAQRPAEVVDEAKQFVELARDYYDNDPARLLTLQGPARRLVGQLVDLLGSDRAAFDEALPDVVSLCNYPLLSVDEREEMFSTLERAVAVAGGVPRGSASLLRELSSIAFHQQNVGGIVPRWRQLVRLHPPGPRRVWIQIAAARSLINHCGAAAEADELLSEALTDLQTMDEWSPDVSAGFVKDADIWVTLDERVGAASWHDAHGHVLLLRGFARWRCGRTLPAIADLEAALAPLERVENVHRIANLGHNLAFARLQLGDYERALAEAERTQRAYARATWSHEGFDRNGVQAMQLVRARVLLERRQPGDEAAAVELLRELLADIGRPELNASNGEALFALVDALLRRATIEADGAEIDRLLESGAMVAARSRAAAAEYDVLRARRHLQRGELSAARASARDALARCVGENQPQLVVQAQLVIAAAARVEGDFDASMVALVHASEELRRVVCVQQMWHLHGSVRAFLIRFEELLQSALDTARARVAGGELHPADLHALYRVFQAFHGFESWCWLLQEQGSTAPAASPELGLKQRERDELLARGRKRDALPPRAPRDYAQYLAEREVDARALERLDVQIAELQRQLRPKLNSLVSEPPALAEVQATLAAEEVVVECLELSNEALAFVLTRERVALRALPAGPEWRSAMSSWRTRRDRSRELTEVTDEELLARISRLLLPRGGWFERLLDRDGAQLLWSPSGTLCELPIAALESRDERLCERVAITHVLSSGLLARSRLLGAGVEREPCLVAMGDPRYPEAVVLEAMHRGIVADGVFPRLPATRDEVLAVARLFATSDELSLLDGRTIADDTVLTGQRFRVFLGSAAHKRSLSSELLETATMLHFACHACCDTATPARSFLALSLLGDADLRETDQFVRLYDLCRMRGDYELMTLSACETAAGVSTPHAASMSLAWAARIAGGRRVLATGWRISDKSAQRLVVAFYRRWMVDGVPAAAALREVQRDAIDNSLPVRDWATLQLWGEGR